MKQAFESIYRRHRQGLYTLALSITRRPDRAEDAVQEGFARLFGSKAQPAGDLTAYAFATIRNAALDERRRMGAQTVSDADVIFDQQAQPDADPAAQSLQTERHQLVRQALNELTDEQRQTVVMKTYAGLTFEQIAQTLQEPLGTITSRYRRALDKLREKIEQLI